MTDLQNSDICTASDGVGRQQPVPQEHQNPNKKNVSYEDPLNSKDHQWLRHVTEIFLKECVKRKVVLRKPRQNRRIVFSEIRLEMLGKGYNFSEQALHRKFRNLKTHYYYVKNANKKRRSNYILWPYFKQMSEIFSEVRKRKIQVISPLQNKPDKTIRVLNTSLDSSTKQECNPRTIQYSGKLVNLRNELIAFEERRTIAIEAIAAQLVESNRLNRLKLDMLKSGQLSTNE